MGTVLLVDDSPADRALFRTILGRAGHRVAEASSGRDILDQLEEHRPHVVVLDVNLPGVPGFDLCRLIRGDARHGNVPILMLTSQQAEADILGGLEAGADDYVGKDDPHAVIVARLQRLILYRLMNQSAILNEQLASVGRLVAGVVHEIRGPLSVIRGHAELLQFEQQAAGGELAWVEPILRNVALLQSRLEFLMASVRAGRARREECLVRELVREAVNLYSKGVDPLRETLTIEVRGNDGDWRCSADGGQFIQALLCLLGHSHRVSSAGGRRAELNLLVSGHPEVVRIDLEDNGPPFPPTHLDRVFEPFFPARPGEDGFGLHLAATIVAEHGGRIAAENLDGSGVRLTIWLPLHHPSS